MNKTELIIDIVEHSERYSDSQMLEILSDDEAMQSYTALLEARMAIDRDTAKHVDVDSAWNRFAAQNEELLDRHHADCRSALPGGRHKLIYANWRKLAAACAVAIAVSGITFAAIRIAGAYVGRQHSQTTDAVQPDASATTVASADTSTVASAASVGVTDAANIVHKTFENVALADMLHEIASYYGIDIEFRNAEARHLRYYYEWNSADGINAVVDELNHSERVSLTLDGRKIIVE